MVNRRVTREDWIGAAIAGLAEGGVPSLSVEGLARGLGVTKGSFYNYFAGLDGLVVEVVGTWERVATEEVIGTLEALEDPTERLRQLFLVTMDRVDHLKAEAALIAAAIAGDPRVRPVYLRVNRRRLSYTKQLYAALCVDEAQAEQFALTAYGSYLGALQLIALGSSSFRTQADLAAHAQHLLGALVPRRRRKARTPAA